jgi:hypothetical protein
MMLQAGFESGAVQDVTISNNTFEECGHNSGSGAIAIAPENHELVAGNMVHRISAFSTIRLKYMMMLFLQHAVWITWYLLAIKLFIQILQIKEINNLQ